MCLETQAFPNAINVPAVSPQNWSLSLTNPYTVANASYSLTVTAINTAGRADSTVEVKTDGEFGGGFGEGEAGETILFGRRGGQTNGQ